MISDSIKKFAAEFPQLRNTPYGSNQTTRMLTNDIPQNIISTFDLNPAEYLVKGSVGNGRWVDVPWFSIMHRGVTTSTQNGYYVTGLFSRDLQTLFITIGLGWTQFEELYGTRLGKQKVSEVAGKLAKLIPENDKYTIGEIVLGAQTQRSKGYEVANAISTKLSIDTIENDDIVQILKDYLAHYELIRKSYGADIFFSSTSNEESTEIDLESTSEIRDRSVDIDKGLALAKLQSLADTLPPTKRKRYVSEIIRNAAFANYVKSRANFICEICGRMPFVKRSNKPYAEADHIDPLYTTGLDHPDNMRCLCALCHRIVTYGSDEEIAKLFVKNES